MSRYFQRQCAKDRSAAKTALKAATIASSSPGRYARMVMPAALSGGAARDGCESGCSGC